MEKLDGERRSGSKTLLAALFLGAVLAFVFLPSIARALPNATSRIGAVRRVIDTGETPELVVVGNSVVMGGLDVEVLTAGSDAHQTGWNLSSQGQGLLESLFIVDQLEAGVETLVLPVEIRSIQDIEYTIPSSKVYAYELYGYEFSPVLSEAIRTVADQETQDVFFDSWIEKRLGARSAIRAGIDTAIVEFFTGTDVSEGDEDIYFPTPYENRLSDAGLEARLERNHVERLALPTELPRPFVDLLKTYQGWSEQQDVEIVLLVLPEHPNQQALSPDGYYDALEELFQVEADLRGFELLFPAEMFSDPDYFVDHIHLHTSGAAELTNFVMSEIG